MFNEDFYPTPENIVSKMFEKVNVRGKSLLDPSCGKGDILCHNDNKAYKSYGIEIEPDLQAICKSKGIRLIGSDFLNTVVDVDIDVIVMNPPFSNGDKHLLRAWEVVSDGGTIVCLLNEETVSNPYTKERQLLKSIIDKHGEVESFGNCFSNAERKTNVNVSCVVLKKPEQEKRTYYSGYEFDEETESVFNNTSLSTEFDYDGIIRSDFFMALENCHAEAKTAFLEALDAIEKAKQKSKLFLSDYSIGDLLSGSYSDKEKYSRFKDSLRSSSWRYIVEKTKLLSVATSRLRQDLDSFITEQSNIAFTKENIIAVVEMLFNNRHAYMRNALLDVFETLTKYDKENKIHWEGWKTNDCYKVNHKVIIPSIVSYDKTRTWRKWELSYYGNRSLLHDIDIAMGYATNTKVLDTETLYYWIERKLDIANKSDEDSVVGESRFFEFKCFKKGTLHIWFKREEDWMRFNLLAAQGKMWLPPSDMKAKEAEERERNKRVKYANSYWERVKKENAAREKYIRDNEILFAPANKRGETIISCLNKEGFKTQEYKDEGNNTPTSNMLCVLSKNTVVTLLSYYDRIDVYGDDDNITHTIHFTENGKKLSINDIADNLIANIKEHDLENAPVSTQLELL